VQSNTATSVSRTHDMFQTHTPGNGGWTVNPVQNPIQVSVICMVEVPVGGEGHQIGRLQHSCMMGVAEIRHIHDVPQISTRCPGSFEFSHDLSDPEITSRGIHY